MQKESSSFDFSLFPSKNVVLVTVGRNIITLGMIRIASVDPPIIEIAIHPSRYSHDLLKGTGDFVVNVCTDNLVNELNFCGSKSGRDVDKFKETGLTAVKGEKVSSMVIGESPLNFECKLISQETRETHTWFIGEVVTVHRAKDFDISDALYNHYGPKGEGTYRRIRDDCVQGCVCKA